MPKDVSEMDFLALKRDFEIEVDYSKETRKTMQK